MPTLTEQLDPERILLLLIFPKSAINAKTKERIIRYLTDHAEVKDSAIAEYISLKSSPTSDYLNVFSVK